MDMMWSRIFFIKTDCERSEVNVWAISELTELESEKGKKKL